MFLDLNDFLSNFIILNKDSLDHFIQFLSNNLLEVTKQICRYDRISNINSKWWNPILNNLKKEVYCSRKYTQSLRRRIEEYQFAHDEYTEKLNAYKYETKRSKTNSWNNFVQNNLAKGPWRVVYKLAANKLNLNSIPVSIKRLDGSSTLQIPHTIPSS